MGKNRGPIPCTQCDYRFASQANLQQASRFRVFPGKTTDLSPQHVRDKHLNIPTKVPTVQTQTPAQEPRVQTVRILLFYG